MANTETLITMFNELKNHIRAFYFKNSKLDAQGVINMNDILTSCDAMDYYIQNTKEEPKMTYEQACAILKPSTEIPEDHLGPTPAMKAYVESEKKKRIDMVNRMVSFAKEFADTK